MNNLCLKEVTLLGIDCVDVERLVLAAEICQKHIDFGAVKLLTHLHSDYPHIVPITPITTIKAYSHFMIKELYKYISTKYVLIIQWDGFVLNHLNWENDFLNYDYIGAPWKHRDNLTVGNGGFSFRSYALLKYLALDANIDNCHPEDFIICKRHRADLESNGFRFAPEEMARKFSVESESWNGQFGYHQTDISKANLHTLIDKNWHSKLMETYIALNSRRIAMQGAGNHPEPPGSVIVL